MEVVLPIRTLLPATECHLLNTQQFSALTGSCDLAGFQMVLLNLTCARTLPLLHRIGFR